MNPFIIRCKLYNTGKLNWCRSGMKKPTRYRLYLRYLIKNLSPVYMYRLKHNNPNLFPF